MSSTKPVSVKGRLIRLAFGVAGLAFLAVALRTSWERSKTDVVPPAWRIAVVVVLAAIAVFCSARAWLSLIPVEGRRGALLRGFYLAQLGKYVPGAVWQVAGQVGAATQAGISLLRSSVVVLVHALTLVAAGGTVAATVGVTQGAISGPVRILMTLSVVVLLVLHRRWMTWSVTAIARLLRKNIEPDVIPPRDAILRSFLWNAATMLAGGASFALLVSAQPSVAPAGALIASFAFAWTLGFVALPFPAGVGVREAVLLAALPSVATAAVITASVWQRMAAMLAEVTMIGVSAGKGAVDRRKRARLDDVRPAG